MTAKKQKKKRQVRNKARDMIGDYYKSNRMVEEDNRRRQEQEQQPQPKGLKHLNANETVYVVVIVLGLIGIFVKYVILR